MTEAFRVDAAVGKMDFSTNYDLLHLSVCQVKQIKVCVLLLWHTHLQDLVYHRVLRGLQDLVNPLVPASQRLVPALQPGPG